MKKICLIKSKRYVIYAKQGFSMFKKGFECLGENTEKYITF